MPQNIAGINVFANMPPWDMPTTGRIFFVGSTAVPGGVVGSDNAAPANGDSPQNPFATIDYAIGQCTASRGDTIIVLPGHAETVTAAITLDVAGVRIIGMGWGRLRPTVTPSGAIDAMTITAANCWVENIRFVGASASVTAQINVAAADAVIKNCVIEQDATPLVGVSVTAAGDRPSFIDCLWYGTAAGPDVGIDIEGDATDGLVKNCMFMYTQSAGLDLAGIRSSFHSTGWVIEDCTFMDMDATAIDFNSSASVSDGIVRNCHFHATAALTSIEDIVDAGGYHFFECYAHDGTNATTAAARVPLGTVS